MDACGQLGAGYRFAEPERVARPVIRDGPVNVVPTVSREGAPGSRPNPPEDGEPHPETHEESRDPMMLRAFVHRYEPEKECADPEEASANKHRLESCPDCDLRGDVSVGNTIGFLKLGAYICNCTGCGTTTKLPDPSNRRVTRS